MVNTLLKNNKKTQLASMFTGSDDGVVDTEIFTHKIVNNIKTLHDIQDDIQDESLEIIVNTTKSELRVKLKAVNESIEDIPVELSFIVQEISIRRFNRIGSEGFQSDSVEGHSVTFYNMDDYFKPYEDIIESYKIDNNLIINSGLNRYYRKIKNLKNRRGLFWMV